MSALYPVSLIKRRRATAAEMEELRRIPDPVRRGMSPSRSSMQGSSADCSTGETVTLEDYLAMCRAGEAKFSIAEAARVAYQACHTRPRLRSPVDARTSWAIQRCEYSRPNSFAAKGTPALQRHARTHPDTCGARGTFDNVEDCAAEMAACPRTCSRPSSTPARNAASTRLTTIVDETRCRATVVRIGGDLAQALGRCGPCWRLRPSNPPEVAQATETTWFQVLATECSAICFPRGRVRFLDPGGDPSGVPLQGQAAIYAGAEPGSFAEAFDRFGFVVPAGRRLDLFNRREIEGFAAGGTRRPRQMWA